MRLPSDLHRWPWHLRYATLGGLSSRTRRWMAQATHLHANIVFEGDVWIGPRFTLRIFENGATLRVGSGVEFRRDFTCEIAGQGKVTIGDGCVFTALSMIQCSTSIDIGPGALIGQGVLLADGRHEFRRPDQDFLEQGYRFRPLSIGPGAALHTNAVVTSDVGERAVIGANSVVTRPIPPYCLAVGAPARVVEYFGPPELRPDDLPDSATRPE